MGRLVVVLGLAAGLSAPVAAYAADSANSTPPASAPSAPAKPAQDDPDRIVCTREHVVGSNRPKKVCMTVAQREEYRDQTRRTMDESRRGPGSKGVMNGGDGRGGGGPF